MLDVVFIVVILGCLGLLITRFRTLNRSELGSLIEASWEEENSQQEVTEVSSEDPLPPAPPGITIPSESDK